MKICKQEFERLVKDHNLENVNCHSSNIEKYEDPGIFSSLVHDKSEDTYEILPLSK